MTDAEIITFFDTAIATSFGAKITSVSQAIAF